MRWFNQSGTGSIEGAFQRKSRLLVLVLAAVMLLLIIVLAYAAIRDKSTEDKAGKSAYLLLADYSKNKAIIQNTSGKVIASADFPYPSSYLTSHTVTPGGAVLMSVGAGSSNEAFFFANNQQKTEINQESSKVLMSAVSMNGKRNVGFINEDTAVLVSCPSGQTCKLSRVAILSGKTEVLADTNVQGSPFTPVYIMGVTNDRKSVYLRVTGANKLGAGTSAVYKFDLATKKTVSTVKLPIDAGQTLRLSPDEKTLVYKTGGLDKEVELRLVDIATGKETKHTWNKSEIANSPDAFVWAPDGQKILFLSSSTIARATAAADNPQKLAYLDIKNNKITELQTITKTYLSSILYYSWLDNDDIIYEQATTTKENDFTNARKEVYEQKIPSKKVSKIEMAAKLQEVLYW